MTTHQFIIQQRLRQQQIVGSTLTSSAEVVRWMGAVQAQDYYGSLWAIALRMTRASGASESSLEKSFADKSIVRSWPMRGTLHIVPSEDLHWMSRLLTPRVIARSKGLYKQMELDKTVFAKSEKVLTKALQGGKQLTRSEIYEVLEKARISTLQQRGLHILGHLAQSGLLCLGTREGKQHRFTLLDEWIPNPTAKSRDESLATLARQYFNSHGPATLQDFSWWSGLSTTDALAALDMIKSQLEVIRTKDGEYWMSQNLPEQKAVSSLFLLPAYDEYTVAYKDRSIILDPNDAKKVGNGIFNPVIIKAGKIAGTWKRSIKKADVKVETSLLPSHKNIKGVASMVKKYAEFAKAESLKLCLLLK